MKNKHPLVSVIVPNYNHRSYLAKRLESVLEQTYTDFELLYLDDASSDGSEEVFRRYADNPRIRAYHNLANTGNPFIQWNKGVTLARGKYIWVAEADDFADTRFLETLVPILERNPNVGIAYAQSYAVDENDEVFLSFKDQIGKIDAEHWKQAYIERGETEVNRYLVQGNTIPNASAVLFRKEVFEKAGSANPDYRLCGDWMLWVRMLKISDVAFVPEHLNYFRQHGANVRTQQTRSGRNFYESFKVLHYIRSAFNPDMPALRTMSETLVKRMIRSFFDGLISPILLMRIILLGMKVDSRLYRYVAEAAIVQVYSRYMRLAGKEEEMIERRRLRLEKENGEK